MKQINVSWAGIMKNSDNELFLYILKDALYNIAITFLKYGKQPLEKHSFIETISYIWLPLFTL